MERVQHAVVEGMRLERARLARAAAAAAIDTIVGIRAAHTNGGSVTAQQDEGRSLPVELARLWRGGVRR